MQEALMVGEHRYDPALLVIKTPAIRTTACQGRRADTNVQAWTLC